MLDALESRTRKEKSLWLILQESCCRTKHKKNLTLIPVIGQGSPEKGQEAAEKRLGSSASYSTEPLNTSQLSTSTAM